MSSHSISQLCADGAGTDAAGQTGTRKRTECDAGLGGTGDAGLKMFKNIEECAAIFAISSRNSGFVRQLGAFTQMKFQLQVVCVERPLQAENASLV